jgi:hypothetical protein
MVCRVQIGPYVKVVLFFGSTLTEKHFDEMTLRLGDFVNYICQLLAYTNRSTDCLFLCTP